MFKDDKCIVAIDLKSFFAACECLERGLNLYTTPLVVCDPKRNGSITLAVTPYLKTKGVKGRTRVYDLPKNIRILKVPPRMSLYIKKSEEVKKVYHEYVAPEDIHVYSIDEVFLDITNYLSLYKKNPVEITEEILNRIKIKTGLVASAGIGPNLLLAKIAMDIDAKNSPKNIALWNKKDIQTKLWLITPLSRMWGIGSRMEKKLNNLGLFKIGDIANFDKAILKDKFGIIGEELWYHANGIDLTKISDLNKEAKEQSINHSQVLFKDYYGHNILLIIEEMIEHLTKRLRQMRKQCALIGLGIGYSKDIDGGFYHQTKLSNPTKNIKDIYKESILIFDKYYEDLPIRKVTITFGRLTDDDSVQLSLFESVEEIKEYDSAYKTIDEIKNKFGSNSIVKASSLLSDSTAISRNKKL